MITEDTHLLSAGRFLYESGLLFEINRRILHPVGLALSINYDDQDGALSEEEAVVTLSQNLQDYRDDPEGMIFDEEALAYGHEKYKKFFNDFVKDKLLQRAELLGYVVQATEQLSNAKVAPPVLERPVEEIFEEIEKSLNEENPVVDDEATRLLIEKNNEKRTMEPISSLVSDFKGIKKTEDNKDAPLDDVGFVDKDNLRKIKRYLGIAHPKQGRFGQQCISTAENTVHSPIAGGAGIVICTSCGRTLNDSDLNS